MQKYQNNVQTLDGRAIVGASVTVTEFPGGAPATVYNSNGSGVITQPILTNGDGEFAFYAANGRYQLQVTGGGISVAQTITDIVLFDPEDAGGVITGSELANTSDSAQGDALVGVKQPFTGSVAQTQHDINAQFVTLSNFGGGPAVANNAMAMASAIAYCLASKKKLLLPSGDIVIEDAEFVLSAPIVIEGEGRQSTRLVFKGTPPKTVRTYAVWRTEYDSGNFASSSDSAIGCGFVITSQGVFLRDMRIFAHWDSSINHPLPFNSATDYPTSGYDNCILIQRSDVTLERLLIDGPWGLTGNNGGIKLDVSQPGGAIEHIKIHDSEVHGRWGLAIEGAHGAGAAPNYSDLAAADTRGSGGVSDLCCVGSQFYDTQLRLTIDGVSNKLVRRFASDGGPIFIDGQVEANTAKRIQQMSFFRCRFANADFYTMYLNFCNRVEFEDCHTEFRSGGFLTDGVTPVTASDSNGVTSTVNARKILFVGGEKSGEPDNLTYKDTVNSINLVTEIARDDPDPPGSTPEARMVGGFEWRDRGTWTPSFTASTPGAPTYSLQSGVYVRLGNIVFVQGRVNLSAKGGIAGNISIAGLPFTATNLYGNSDAAMMVAVAANITMGDAGIGVSIDNNTKTALLFKLRSGLSAQNVTDADLTDTSNIQFSGMYITEEP